ncbi:hypothetical protein [Cellulomonas pakistanensis]|uniref:Uncharacterized protein n=1 Tax=Cellulomonas pakistanensis TaxID=992287 RepID=A0A919PAT7_9CELL|nr:hypothetical protein [Cellulomonas pakistanensis]GIG36226.1 hypothetical protein Cpa01nite_16070 [Cellulomonas pakistanensis]
MTDAPDTPTPLLGITAGNPGFDRQLRAQLTVLRDRSAGTELGSVLDDVLAGRRSLRDAARTTAFAGAVEPAVAESTAAWARMTSEQRSELAAEGEREMQAPPSDLER